MKTLVSFIAEGLRQRERCVWVPNENTPEEASSVLSAAGIRPKEEIANGALIILTKHETYLKDGRFVPEKIVGQLQQFVDETTLRGFRALRAAGELSWAFEKNSGVCDEVPGYELLVDDYFLKEKPHLLALCQYNARQVPPTELKKVRSAHRLTLQD